MRYDAVVLGLGGMGSAVAAHAAAHGMRVLGVERFGPVHDLGASHGRTRIIRQAYFESPAYVPLLRRAYDLWDALEAQSGLALRARTGGVFAGAPESTVVAGTLASARAWDLEHEVLDAAALHARFPALRPRPDEIGVYERVSGALFPEAGVRAHLLAAAAAGAELRFSTAVSGWEAGAGTVRVTLADGEIVDAARLAVCAGPWFSEAAHDAGVPIRVERNVQFWFTPRDAAAVSPERLPIWCLARGEEPMLYGFPDFGDGAKVAHHGSGIDADPDTLDRTIGDDEIARARSALLAFVPSAAGAYRRASACMYTLTPDEHFVIGAHPGAERVVLAGGFSGHGYKFAPVVGEIVAALLAGDDPGFDLTPFSPARFAAESSARRPR